MIGTGTGRLGNKKTSRNHPNYSIIKIDQNAEKSPRHLRRLAVIQTQVKNHQLMLVMKALKGVDNNNRFRLRKCKFMKFSEILI